MSSSPAGSSEKRWETGRACRGSRYGAAAASALAPLSSCWPGLSRAPARPPPSRRSTHWSQAMARWSAAVAMPGALAAESPASGTIWAWPAPSRAPPAPSAAQKWPRGSSFSRGPPPESCTTWAGLVRRRMSATRSRPRPWIHPCVLTTTGSDTCRRALRRPSPRRATRAATAAALSSCSHLCSSATASKYTTGLALGEVSPMKKLRWGSCWCRCGGPVSGSVTRETETRPGSVNSGWPQSVSR
mmetsp:Transcript_32165/g.90066  ORF Transcript_32165/g.90066 Transcript_32165/m.90066 type:complete len:244 (+) Transcript_32165:638-1369(+)